MAPKNWFDWKMKRWKQPKSCTNNVDRHPAPLAAMFVTQPQCYGPVNHKPTLLSALPCVAWADHRPCGIAVFSFWIVIGNFCHPAQQPKSLVRCYTMYVMIVLVLSKVYSINVVSHTVLSIWLLCKTIESREICGIGPDWLLLKGKEPSKALRPNWPKKNTVEVTM